MLVLLLLGNVEDKQVWVSPRDAAQSPVLPEPQQSSPPVSAEGLLSLVLECLSLSLTQLGKSRAFLALP